MSNKLPQILVPQTNQTIVRTQMKKFICLAILILHLFICQAALKHSIHLQYTASSFDTSTLFDQTRNRAIPVAIYNPKNTHAQIIILSHGYGQNNPYSYLAYSYLGKYLARKGYFVISIQHELPNDSLMPTSGIPQIVRKPFWDRGADNILFVINELKKTYPNLDFTHITLIGHSNGGDMSALFPQKYPNIVQQIISLDNRRVTLPKMMNLKVYSLRSKDQPADDGVLPTPAEQQSYGITIIKLANTNHNDMDNHANHRQRKEIRKYILSFLNE